MFQTVPLKRANVSRQRQVTRRRNAFLSFESLESRTVLAGDVTASVTNGFLVLNGDSGDNRIAITQSANGGIQISALDGTTINGQAGPVSLGNVTQGARINLGSGDDLLQLTGDASSPLTFAGTTNIDLGNGDDELQFSNFNAATLLVQGGNGEDSILAARDFDDANATVGSGLTVSGTTVVQSGNGDDLVSLQNSTLGSLTFINAGNGADVLDVRSTAGRLALLLGGNGSDTLHLAGNTLSNVFNFQFETKANVSGPIAVNDTLTVERGASATVDVLANDIAGNATLDTGSVVIVRQPTSGTATVNNDGTITYVNNGGASTRDSFTYTVLDANGNVSTTATVNVTVTPVNALPTISPIANVTTPEDVATNLLPFTVGDAETSAGALRVTATSSNTSVVANSGITIVGSGANRSVRITPVANASGSSTITLTVKDAAGATSTTSFLVTVTPVNDLPTITGLTNVSAALNAAINPIPITVGDVETPAGSVQVSATSSNQALLPNANIQINGTGANRTITLTPVANVTGTSTITVTANDGTGGVLTKTFTVSVSSAPTISDIPDQVTAEDTATASTAFTIGDVETLAGNLRITTSSSNTGVVAANGIQVTGSGANRSIVVTPVANATGNSTITVTVTDEAGVTATDTFVVTVTPVNDAPVVRNETLKANAYAMSTVTLVGNLLANDTDIDGPNALSISRITIGGTVTNIPANGQVSVDTAFGHIIVNANGSYTYTYKYVPGSPSAQAIDFLAANHLLPAVDRIDYSVTDGLLTTTGSLTVNLNGHAGHHHDGDHGDDGDDREDNDDQGEDD